MTLACALAMCADSMVLGDRHVASPRRLGGQSRIGTASKRRDSHSGTKYVYNYFECKECVAHIEEVTIAEAVRIIERPRTKKHVRRGNKYRKALTEVTNVWTVLVEEIGSHSAVPDVSDTASTAAQRATGSAMDSDTLGPGGNVKNKKERRAMRRLLMSRLLQLRTSLRPACTSWQSE